MLKQNKTKKNINIMHNRKVNKIRYGDPRKPMKQTYFTVKDLGGNLPEKQFIIVKRSFRSSTKPFVPKLYSPRRWTYSKNLLPLQNLWTLQYMNATFLHEFQYMTNQWCAAPSTWLIHQIEEDCWLQSSSLHQQWRLRSTWLQNSWRKDVTTSTMNYDNFVSDHNMRARTIATTFASLLTTLKIILIYV